MSNLTVCRHLGLWSGFTTVAVRSDSADGLSSYCLGCLASANRCLAVNRKRVLNKGTEGTNGNRFALSLSECLAVRWTAADLRDFSARKTVGRCRKGCIHPRRNRGRSQGRDHAPGRNRPVHLDPRSRADLWPSDSIAAGRGPFFWCAAPGAHSSLHRSSGGASPTRSRIRPLVLHCRASRKRLRI